MAKKVDSMAISLEYMRAGSAIPPPAVFRLGGSTNIDVFFRSFEQYCRYKYPRSEESWSRVFGPFLQGEIKTAFEVLDGTRQDYTVVKGHRKTSSTADNDGWKTTSQIFRSHPKCLRIFIGSGSTSGADGKQCLPNRNRRHPGGDGADKVHGTHSATLELTS